MAGLLGDLSQNGGNGSISHRRLGESVHHFAFSFGSASALGFESGSDMNEFSGSQTIVFV
jgi:hypothetical protein